MVRLRLPTSPLQWLSLAAPLLGGLFTVALFAAARQSQDQQAALRFAATAAEVRAQVHSQLRIYTDLLQAVRGIAEAQGGELHQAQLREFLASVDLPRRYAGLLGVTYGIPVAPEQREQALQRLRSEQGNPQLNVHPAWGPGPDALVILAAPLESNRLALGFNSALTADQRASLWAARDLGTLQASQPTRVAQAPTAGPGVVLRVPVYRQPAATLAERRQHFAGYVNAVMLLEHLAAQAAQRAQAVAAGLTLSDVTEDLASTPFFEVPRPVVGALWQLAAPSGFTDVSQFEVGGRRWRLELRADEAFYLPSEVIWPWSLAVPSVLIGLLLLGLASARSTMVRRAQTLAAEMTERLRASESHMRAIVEVTPDKIFVVASTGEFVEVWSADPRPLADSAAALLGHHLREFLPAETAELAQTCIAKALATQSLQSFEYSLGAPSGARQFEALVLPLDAQAQPQTCALWVARDITERRAQEAALLQTQKLDGLGLLAGGIAHDFNNLLGAVQGHLSLARLAVADQQDPQPHFDHMSQAVRRAADLARQLLAYAGRARVVVEPVDLNRLIADMGSLLAVSVPKKVEVVRTAAEDLPMIMANPAQLQQVVMNLVSNAAEAIGDRAGRLELTTSWCALSAADIERRLPGQNLEAGRYVCLTARDTGPGMAPEVLARLFDPFYTTKPTGRGLGLSVVLGVMRSHRGGVQVESQPGQGTTFSLFFKADARAVATPVPPPRIAETAPLTGTLLVADDDDVLREVAQRMGERLGLRVQVATDGLQAWERFGELRDGDLSAVMLDLTMPGLSGLEVYRRVREVAPTLPVVLNSGYSRDELPVEPPGTPTAFLQKPFGYAEFSAALRSVWPAAEPRATADAAHGGATNTPPF
ncbi:MAG: CHASE domain-containing protein [Deltaproteobacteria bacterium]|nr:CHASE domain-containing protein [Deltaproteobacteria bacterium]